MNGERADLRDWGATVLRLSLAVMWLAHGGLKLLVFTVPGLAGWLTTQGLPSGMAWPLTLAELLGGLLLLIGWRGPWVSLALSPILLGALWLHAGNGWVHTSPGGGWEYPLFLLLASAAHVLMGDGRLAMQPRRLRKP